MQNTPASKNANPQKSKTKSRISKRQRNRRRHKQKSLNCNQNKVPLHFYQSQSTRDGAEIWREAYENAIRWHGEHQNNYWRRAADNLQRENQMLRQQLELNYVSRPKPDIYYETSDDDTVNQENGISVKNEESGKGNEDIDVEYLEFLQITFKHREELRLKRHAEAEEEVDSPAILD